MKISVDSLWHTLQKVQQPRRDSSFRWVVPAMCGGSRHGSISVLDSRQTLELSQGASVSNMTVFYGRPSLTILPRHSMPGNICKQWPPTKELWLCRGSSLTGIDVNWDGCWPSTGTHHCPAALGHSHVCHRPGEGVCHLSSSWGLWQCLNPIILVYEKELCNPRSVSTERGHLQIYKKSAGFNFM